MDNRQYSILVIFLGFLLSLYQLVISFLNKELLAIFTGFSLILTYLFTFNRMSEIRVFLRRYKLSTKLVIPVLIISVLIVFYSAAKALIAIVYAITIHHSTDLYWLLSISLIILLGSFLGLISKIND